MFTKITRYTKILTALFMAVFAQSVVPVTIAQAMHDGTAHENNGTDKVFVCKYVGTPHIDERLQTGDNPISVSVSSIQNNQWDGTVPGWFSDEHDRSYVLAYDTGQPEPDVSQCPAPEGPPSQVTPTAPTNIDLCGTDDDTYTIPDTEGVTYYINNTPQTSGQHDYTTGTNLAITAEANENYELAPGATTSWTLPFSDEACGTDLIPATPVKPDSVDLCGTDNDSFTVPTANGVTYYLSNDLGTALVNGQTYPTEGALTIAVTAFPNEGYAFGENQASVSWTLTFTNEACQPNTQEKVEICHRTGSRTNPYVKIEVSTAAADGIAGNSGQQADHFDEHEGPLFNPDLPKNTEWGDIIPPVAPHHNGLNWTTEGQAIYNNNCTTPVELLVTTQPCVDRQVGTGALLIDIDGSANGAQLSVSQNGNVVFSQDIDENTDLPIEINNLAPGDYVVSLTKNGQPLTEAQLATVEECPDEEPATAQLSASAVCVPATRGVQPVITVTVTNTGNAAGTATIEGGTPSSVTVQPGESQDATLPVNVLTDRTPVKVSFNSELILDKTLNCLTDGIGGGPGPIPTEPPAVTPTEAPTTPAPEVPSDQLPSSLPVTGPTDNTPLVMLTGALLAYGATYLLQGRRQHDQIRS